VLNVRAGKHGFLIALGIIVVGLVALAAILGTWWDEEYSMATTAHGVAYAFDRALHFELQAPLYFVLLALWRGLDASLLFARLSSVLCIVGLCFALRAIGRRVWPQADPLPFVVLAVANPFVVYAALEVRLYAFALLLSALAWLMFYDGFLAGEDRRARIWFCVIAIASIYTQYYLGFMLFGGFVALLVAQRWGALRAFALACAAVAAASAPVALWVPGQASAAYTGHESVLRRIKWIAQAPALLGLPFTYDWSGVWRFLAWAHHAAFVAIVAIFGVWALPRLERVRVAIVAIPVAIWTLYLLAGLALHIQYIIPRHFVGLCIPLLIALYALVAQLFEGGRPAVGRAVVTVYAFFTLATLLTTYRALAKPGDWPRVAQYLNAHAQAGDAIAVFPSRGYPEVIRTYRGPAAVAGFPRPEPNDRFDEDAPAVHSRADASAALRRLNAGHRVWLVMEGSCGGEKPHDGCDYLEAVLKSEYPNAHATRFYLNKVIEIPAH